MLNLIFIEIFQEKYFYNSVIVEQDGVSIIQNKVSSRNSINVRNKKFVVNGIFVHYFLQELTYAPYYRSKFIDSQLCNVIQFALTPVKLQIIDYNWNYRITYLVRQRCELEHILSWLSTLGGAFSALGDYFQECAEVAGKISVNQLKLAFQLGDPYVVSRCRLYFSLSLIQRYYFKLARKIIQAEFKQAKNNIIRDVRLINMCKGIWCKYKYEYENYRNCKKQKKIK